MNTFSSDMTICLSAAWQTILPYPLPLGTYWFD